MSIYAECGMTFYRAPSGQRVMPGPVFAAGDQAVHLGCPTAPANAPALCGWTAPPDRKPPPLDAEPDCPSCLARSTRACPVCGCNHAKGWSVDDPTNTKESNA